MLVWRKQRNRWPRSAHPTLPPQSNAQPAHEGDDQQRSARRPEYTAKVGNVEIAVWKNVGQNGDFFTASSLVIRYKDGTSGEFKDGSSYGQLDLLALAEAAREASAKIPKCPRVAPKAVNREFLGAIKKGGPFPPRFAPYLFGTAFFSRTPG